MTMAAIQVDGMDDREERGLRRFLVPSLVVHALGFALVVGVFMRLPVPVERPLRVQIVRAAPSPPSAPAAPAAQPVPAVPGGVPARPNAVPELVETPKPRVEEAPRSKRFTGLYDRRGGPGAQDAPDSSTWRKSAPRVEGGSLRGEEAVWPPAVPPKEAPPAKAPPAKSPPPAPSPPAQETKLARADPIPPGRTSIVQQPPPTPAPAAPGATTTATAPPSGAASGSAPSPRPSHTLRDQVAGLRPDYRPPVDDPGTAGDPGGRGDPGLETFRFKYATWGLAVKRDIERAWKVPGYGITSLSIVRFVVLPDGKIRDLQLEKSSGLTSLDEAATNAISGAAPFRPFPPRMREENPGGIDITVNFYYREGRGILQWE